MILLPQGLSLHPEHWAQMEADVRARAGEEACGFVAGTGNRAQLVIPVTNALHSPTRFRMLPEEELQAFLLVEERGLEMLAVYHSHPYGISEPSATDFAELTFPGIIYLIWYQSSGVWHCRGYLMNDQTGAGEVPVIVTEN